jgi:ABC-type transport system involved in multi-copper enzyme maturation permease subunit
MLNVAIASMNLPLLSLTTRSLREDARATRTHLLRAGLVGALLGSLVTAHTMVSFMGAPGLYFFSMTLSVNLLLLTFIGISVFATAITEEKETGSLGLLKLTGMSPLSILLGKSAGLLLGAVLLLAVQLPFTLLAVTLGGISPIQVIAAYVLLAAYAVALCGLGLLWSVVLERNAAATRVTLGSLLGFFWGPSLLGGLLTACKYRGWLAEGGAVDEWIEAALSWWRSLSAFQQSNLIVATGFDGPVVSRATWFSAAAGVVLFAIAWLIFERATRNELAAAPERLARAPKRGRPGSDRAWDEAVVWKDFRFLAGGLSSLGVWTILYGAAIAGALAMMAQSGANVAPKDVGVYTLIVSLLILPIQAAALATRVFGDEVKWKTLSGLALLPASLGAIAYQKVLGASIQLVPGISCAALGFVLTAVMTPDYFADFFGAGEAIIVLIYMIATALFGIHLAAYFSLRVRHGALALTFAAIILGNYVITAPLMVLFDGSEEGPIGFLAMGLLVAAAAMHPLIGARLTHLAAE